MNSFPKFTIRPAKDNNDSGDAYIVEIEGHDPVRLYERATIRNLHIGQTQSLGSDGWLHGIPSVLISHAIDKIGSTERGGFIYYRQKSQPIAGVRWKIAADKSHAFYSWGQNNPDRWVRDTYVPKIDEQWEEYQPSNP